MKSWRSSDTDLSRASAIHPSTQDISTKRHPNKTLNLIIFLLSIYMDLKPQYINPIRTVYVMYNTPHPPNPINMNKSADSKSVNTYKSRCSFTNLNRFDQGCFFIAPSNRIAGWRVRKTPWHPQIGSNRLLNAFNKKSFKKLSQNRFRKKGFRDPEKV